MLAARVHERARCPPPAPARHTALSRPPNAANGRRTGQGARMGSTLLTSALLRWSSWCLAHAVRNQARRSRESDRARRCLRRGTCSQARRFVSAKHDVPNRSKKTRCAERRAHTMRRVFVSALEPVAVLDRRCKRLSKTRGCTRPRFTTLVALRPRCLRKVLTEIVPVRIPTLAGFPLTHRSIPSHRVARLPATNRTRSRSRMPQPPASTP